ncbi:type II toxin-antitoxin system RelE/ParE family toxin [Caulobacter sp. Root487D2Y]|uniref:type II toxin-antitoxin system RelE/ParE family toxin n=1 Tax=Caulobacter sp. Root487D2Y TaxID=1736547 RepID=UPI0012E3B1E4|nr:type II toxin-antitoxin system RelE/ParE family toxin [Caulobacter sp. Root487D2Y]
MERPTPPISVPGWKPPSIASSTTPERSPTSRDDRYRELFVQFHSNQYVVQYQVRGELVVILRIFHGLEDR